MSTPIPTTSKGPRNPRRNRKPSKITPLANNTHLSDSPNRFIPPKPRSSPPSPSTEEAFSNTLSEGASQKRKSRFGKKNSQNNQNNQNNQNSKPSPAVNGTGHSHRHSASQPNILSSLPDGSHYAGPTFHASPAPSALPIPTFFSKSVPDTESPDSLEDDSEDTSPQEATPAKPKAAVSIPENAVENPSPLEFLFKSAKGAKVTNRSGSGEPTPGRPSQAQPNVTARVTLHRSERSPGGIFPIELESRDSRRMAIGPSFATPFKDRINALRSASSPSRSNESLPLDEDQRKAKTEALKNLLLNPQPQRPSSASPKVYKDSNIFSSKSWTPGNAVPLSRHASGPSTPIPFGDHKGSPKGSSLGSGSIAHQYLSSVYNGSQATRTPSSNLRRELSSTSPINSTPFSTERGPSSAQNNLKRSQTVVNLASPSPNRTLPYFNSDVSSLRSNSPRTNPVDPRQMEADLRRILKLDSNHS
ncbi:hypothetical protein PAAG_07372 [Paracoccidioides lutzii Pb01]|uniref:Proteophosphoglycan 5 n=1 Tax=Paracoccidioides lutzii (strain ATCC MYA-826 / Pb01) TaxID=502779 RepID=C1H9D1_PARBA|nr:hypothetical protein PAAG_07372 [Paracoccidioides lutzii Pb01]EEH36954.1 hypothetical protein PAAG_07372 [Paracoccidioides lutzii Pb01]